MYLFIKNTSTSTYYINCGKKQSFFQFYCQVFKFLVSKQNVKSTAHSLYSQGVNVFYNQNTRGFLLGRPESYYCNRSN